MAETATIQTGDKARVPTQRGARLPKASLQKAEKLASQLWDLARRSEVPLEAYAKHIGSSSTSSTFDAKVGLLRYFGLIRTKAEKIQLTPVALDLVQTFEPARQENARCSALLSEKHFAKILAENDGEVLPSEDLTYDSPSLRSQPQ